MRSARKALFASLATALASTSTSALADAHQAHSGDLSEQLATLPTGDQLVIENYNGTVSFGGHQVALENFSGVAGYGTEMAYLITVNGEAELGGGEDGMEVGSGKMLLIPTFGQAADVQRFDAARLHEALAADPAVSGLQTVAKLDDMALLQERGIFLGRLGRTSFNVATMGNAQAELDRRERVGAVHVRNARFTGDAGPETVERSIVERFLDALAARDAEMAAQLLDPLPYGMGSMAHGADEARLAMAKSLIAARDWTAFAAATPEQVEETVWQAGGAMVGLRRTTEFAYVETIQVGS